MQQCELPSRKSWTPCTCRKPFVPAIHPQQRIKQQCRASNGNREDQGGGISAEEMFRRELEKRGIHAKDEKESPRSRTGQSSSRPDPAPQTSAENAKSQLELSRKLNSEGLEGLIPRAKQLLSLGFTFWVSFWPIILAISILTISISWLYGDGFIHGGRPSYFKKVSPEEVLSEPAFDKRVPFR